MKGIGTAAIAAMLAGMVEIGSAQAQVTIPQEYEKTIKAAGAISALGDDLFGEQVGLYTGATTFEAIDASLPGNSNLPVAVRRSFIVTSRDAFERNWLLSRDGTFADWELDLPHLYGVFAKNKGWQVDGWSESGKNLRCSLAQANAAEPPTVTGTFNRLWGASEYWHGNSLHVPGGGDQEMLVIAPENANRPSDGKTYVWVTNNQWYFSCLPNTANGIAGDAFLAVDPSGNRYYFNWFAARDVPTITKTGGGSDALMASSAGETGIQTTAASSPGATSLTREEVHILPTRIEDRFGNYLMYTYDATHPWRLLSIAASDGRNLTLGYDAAGHVASVSDGSRTWTYVYGNGLTEVQLPDTRKWLIDFSTLRTAYTAPDGNTSQCERSGAAPTQSIYTGTTTHPSGAVGVFSFQSQPHGRSYVPKICILPSGSLDASNNYARYPYLFNQLAIKQKQISGPGLASAYTWSYSYGPTNQSWEANCGGGCIDSKTVEVTGPANDWVRYTYGNRYKNNEGRLLKVERGANAASIQNVEESAYQTNAGGQLYPARIGSSPFVRGDGMAEKFIPVWKRTQVQQGRTFTWQVDATCGNGTALCYDSYARPTKVSKSSASSA